MNLPRLIRRAIFDWQQWRLTQKLMRAAPEYRQTFENVCEARVHHGKVRPHLREREQIMTSLLRAR